MSADTIVINARIRTMDAARPRAEALAIRDGRILALGNMDEIRGLATQRTRVIDAGGRLVLPGFQDAHVHLLLGGADDEAVGALGVFTRVEQHAAGIVAVAPGAAGLLVVAAHAHQPSAPGSFRLGSGRTHPSKDVGMSK